MSDSTVINKNQDQNFTSNGVFYLVTCPNCGEKNKLSYVSSGTCAHCGWSHDDQEKENGN